MARYQPTDRFIASLWRGMALTDEHRRTMPHKRDQLVDLRKRLMRIITRLYGAPIDLGIPMPKGRKAHG
jgi:hypothetical protein